MPRGDCPGTQLLSFERVFDAIKVPVPVEHDDDELAEAGTLLAETAARFERSFRRDTYDPVSYWSGYGKQAAS